MEEGLYFERENANAKQTGLERRQSGSLAQITLNNLVEWEVVEKARSSDSSLFSDEEPALELRCIEPQGQRGAFPTESNPLSPKSVPPSASMALLGCTQAWRASCLL